MEHPPVVTRKMLSSSEKVAVLLASLDSETSASILKQLEPKTMLKIADAMRRLGVVPGHVRDRAIADCYQGIQEIGTAIQGDDNTVNELLKKAVGEREAALLLDENREDRRAAFAGLSAMSADQLIGILNREQPGVVALVLRYAPPNLAADVIRALPDEVRRKVIVFMCTAAAPAEDIVKVVEQLLSTKITAYKKTKTIMDVDNVALVTGIIQNLPHSMEEDLLSAIQEKSDTLATEIRDRLFTFDDLIGVGSQGLRRLMQEIDMSSLGIALRTAKSELREMFFANMSKRAAETLREEMSFSQKMRVSEVEAKQREIVNVVRQLISDGEISYGVGDEYV